MKARFENGIYRDCKWCGGKGCLACPAEAEKEYKRQFPDGPRPFLSLTHEEVAAHGGLGAVIKQVLATMPQGDA